MRSLLLEIRRLNNLRTGIWRQGDPYLIWAGSDNPLRQFTSPLEHESFLKLIIALRYEKDARTRATTLKQIGEIAANVLGTNSLTEISSGPFPLQLDLVVTPAELAAVPFEAATDSEGRPLFARDDAAVVLTRRVRHAFAETRPRWPATPRLLYAWALLCRNPATYRPRSTRVPCVQSWSLGSLSRTEPAPRPSPTTC